jgi:hypothetical protein
VAHDQPAQAPVRYIDLTVEGWHYGFEKISFTHLLQREAGLDLAVAKHATDDVLANKPVHVKIPADRRDSFIQEAKALGVRDIHSD